MSSFVLTVETGVAKTRVKGTLAICAFVRLRAKYPWISDEVLGKEFGDDVLDIARVDPVDDRLAQGIPKKTLVLGVAVA